MTHGSVRLSHTTRVSSAPARIRKPRWYAKVLSRARSCVHAAAQVTRCALVLAIVLGLSACGGGGSGGGGGGGLVIPDGLIGTIHLPDFYLGRGHLLEPNDTTEQAFRLPPFSSGSRLEAGGTLDLTGAFFGTADPRDCCRIVCLRDQVVAVDLSWAGSTLTGLSIAVTETATGNPIASESALTSPLSLQFNAAAGRDYDISIALVDGSATFVVGFQAVADIAPIQAATAPDGSSAAHKPAHLATRPAEGEPHCTGRHVLVRFASQVDEARVCAQHGLTSLERLPSGTYRMNFPCAPAHSRRREAVSLCERLRSESGVQFAEPDWIVRTQSIPNDPEFGRQWNMRAVSAPAAWDITRGDANVRIAVLDTGLLQDHPDVSNKVVAGYDFISALNVAADGDGPDPNWSDPGDRFLSSGLSSWHGTHVAGIAAASGDDGFGITGVAPGCSLVVLRALGLGGGLVSDVANAIRWGAGLFTTPDGYSVGDAVEVMNLSIGLSQDSTELRNACQAAYDAGVFLVGAAGNTGDDVLYPAAYSTVFCVAATGGALTQSSFISTDYSCFGPEVDIAAPGGLRSQDAFGDGWPDGILSCVRRENLWPHEAGHLYYIGTSQATPHVSGAAALMRSLNPALTNAQLATFLQQSALDINTPGIDEATGAGMLQVHAALRLVLDDLGTPSTALPQLVLPTYALKFEGLQSVVKVPVINGGAGVLQVTSAVATTDDGGAWLSATVLPAGLRTPPSVNSDGIEVSVTRTGLASGVYSGVIRVNTVTGGAPRDIRVVMYVSLFPRLGVDFQLVAFELNGQVAQIATRVTAQSGYRYWVRELPEQEYLLRAGEDLDGDGVFCTAPFEMCGFFGGPTEGDAVPVDFEPGGGPQEDLDIDIGPQ